MMKRPNSVRHLDDAVRRLSDGTPQGFVRVRTLLANAIVASMLSDGVIKGGCAIKMRFGDEATRFTTDLDTAMAMDTVSYITLLDSRLRSGWEGFAGCVVAKRPPSPAGVPAEYVMSPHDVKLEYLGKAWCSVPLEVGHNEVGDADVADWVALDEAAGFFAMLGFPAPGKAPLMPVEHQVAQKLHAVSGGGDRAKDLVDLQLIAARADIDFASTERICQRLFAYRKTQAWPPVIMKQSEWDELYAAAAAGLPVVQDADLAVKWANGLVARICSGE